MIEALSGGDIKPAASHKTTFHSWFTAAFRVSFLPLPLPPTCDPDRSLVMNK
jgi:hypothetical protein